jgi:hypothetical protein
MFYPGTGFLNLSFRIPEICHSEIRDPEKIPPGSGSRIQWVKKAPDPGSETLLWKLER